MSLFSSNDEHFDSLDEALNQFHQNELSLDSPCDEIDNLMEVSLPVPAIQFAEASNVQEAGIYRSTEAPENSRGQAEDDLLFLPIDSTIEIDPFEDLELLQGIHESYRPHSGSCTDFRLTNDEPTFQSHSSSHHLLFDAGVLSGSVIETSRPTRLFNEDRAGVVKETLFETTAGLSTLPDTGPSNFSSQHHGHTAVSTSAEHAVNLKYSSPTTGLRKRKAEGHPAVHSSKPNSIETRAKRQKRRCPASYFGGTHNSSFHRTSQKQSAVSVQEDDANVSPLVPENLICFDRMATEFEQPGRYPISPDQDVELDLGRNSRDLDAGDNAQELPAHHPNSAAFQNKRLVRERPIRTRSQYDEGKRAKGCVKETDGILYWLDRKSDTWLLCVRHSDIRLQLLREHAGAYKPRRATTTPGNRVQADHDETSFLVSQKHWSIKKRVNWGSIGNGILYQIAPPEPRPVGTAPQKLFVDGKLVIDYNNDPINDFPELPHCLSTAFEAGLIMAIMRMNKRIVYKDFLARMPIKESLTRDGSTRPEPTLGPSALGQKVRLWGLRNGVQTWRKRGAGAAFVAALKEKAQAQGCPDNSTEGLRWCASDMKDFLAQDEARREAEKKGKGKVREEPSEQNVNEDFDEDFDEDE